MHPGRRRAEWRTIGVCSSSPHRCSDESCVPVETIELRAPELEGAESEFEIIGQKATVA